MTSTFPARFDPAPNFADSETLRELIATLTATNTWRTSVVARQLMEFAIRKYTPVAKAWHRDPADAGYAAFLAFRAPTTVAANDPWAVVTQAVRLSMAAEEHGDRLLTSSEKARRPTKRPDSEPVRAGHYEDFLYDIHPHSEDHGQEDTVDQLVRTAGVFLVATGWPAKTIEPAVEYICNRVSSLASRESAMGVLTSDTGLARRLGFDDQQWGALLRLLLGTHSTNRSEGTTGIIARILLHDTLDELLTDTDLVGRAHAVSAVRGRD